MDDDRAFKIPEPFVVSLSGGRTSGFMLKRIIDAYGGTLPGGAHVCFANTGKEHENTLEFVKSISDRWEIEVTWIEFAENEKKYRIVNHESAARSGEPFEAMLAKKQRLPSPVRRFCTNELKIQPMRRWMRDIGMGSEASMAIGIRYDEPRRVARLRNRDDLPFEYRFPLHDARITIEHVSKFWEGNTFDLELAKESPFGNCDLCFLKRRSIIAEAIRVAPERAQWWADQEAKYEQRFRVDRPSYEGIRYQVRIQPELFYANDDEEITACHCTD